MKKYILLQLTLVILSGLFIQCSNDDDRPQRTNDNKFTLLSTDFATPNGYLLLDDGPAYTNAFILTFLNGQMREDNVNGASIETTTTHGIALSVTLGSGTVNSESAVTNAIIAGNTYALNDDARVITNITNYTDTYTFGGTQYGDPDDSGATLYEVNTLGSGTVTINSFSVNHTTRTGNIDCDYTLTDENSNTFTGQFVGSFDIINEF